MVPYQFTHLLLKNHTLFLLLFWTHCIVLSSIGHLRHWSYLQRIFRVHCFLSSISDNAYNHIFISSTKLCISVTYYCCFLSSSLVFYFTNVIGSLSSLCSVIKFTLLWDWQASGLYYLYSLKLVVSKLLPLCVFLLSTHESLQFTIYIT